MISHRDNEVSMQNEQNNIMKQIITGSIMMAP